MSKLITISRLRAFRACARYHHLSYNERWEAVDDADANLSFGTAGHRVLETWWTMLGAGASEADVLDASLDRVEADDEIRATLDPFRRASLAALIAGYHLREAKDLRRRIEYHEQAAVLCKGKSKEQGQ